MCSYKATVAMDLTIFNNCTPDKRPAPQCHANNVINPVSYWMGPTPTNSRYLVKKYLIDILQGPPQPKRQRASSVGVQIFLTPSSPLLHLPFWLV